MSTTDPVSTEEDNVSILSFDDLEDDALHGSDVRIQRWLSQQCRFGLDVPKGEKELRSLNVPGLCGAGELLPTVLLKNHRGSSTVSEEFDEAALRADSPLLGFGVEDERTLMDPLHFPSATYVRDLPEFYRKHSPQSSYSSLTTKRTLGLSRRPSLLRQPSLPLLDEQSVTQVISPSAIPPQPSRSRAQSIASISSFHLPTSMQVSIPPLTPASPPSRRHSKIPNSPSLSSSLASFSFGGDDSAKPLPSPIPRPHSQLHHGHRHPPPNQKLPHTLSRSSSTLSLLTHSRNAIYIDEPIDIDSAVDPDDIGFGVDSVVEDGEDDGLPVTNEDHAPLNSHANTSHVDGVYFNPIASSSQVYVGLGTNTKAPTRPPPAPPLIMDGDEKGGLGGVGVVDEDAILNASDEDRHRTLDGDRTVNAVGGGVYLHHHSHRQQQIQFEESDDTHHTDANLRDELDHDADDKPYMSRWSLASSIDEPPTSAGGGLFKSIKRMSLGGDKDKDKMVYKENKEKEIVDKEKGIEEKKEKEKSTDKKRGRLISFISRISSNIASSPPPTPITRPSSPSAGTSTNDGNEHDSPTLGFWFGDMMIPPSPVLPSTLNVGGGSGEKKGKSQKCKEKGSDKFRERVKETALRQLPKIIPNSSTSSPRLSPLSSPSTYSPQLANGSSNGLLHLSPIAKAFSTGFQDAGSALDFMGARSGSALGSTLMDGEMGESIMRARSSSLGDLLGRSAGDGGQYDLYHRQQAFGQQGRQGLVQGLDQEHGRGRGQGPSQHTSAYPHPQLRLQLGEGYSPEPAYHHQVYQHPYEQQQHRQRRQSQFGLQQQQQQLHSSVSDTFYIPASTLALRSPASIDTAGFDATIPRRPGLVKSASTPMLNIDGGRGRGGSRHGYRYGQDATLARRYADLPATPVSFTTTDEEEDYGVEANGRWRDDTLGYGSERERRAMTTTSETDKKLETEHSVIATINNNATFNTPTATPKASIEVAASSSSSIGHDIRASRRRSSNVIVTNTQKPMQSVVRGVAPVVRNEPARTTAGVALTTTLTVKSASSLSKGFRGFMEKMKFTTTNSNSNSSSLSSSMPSPPLIPPMVVVPTNIMSSTSSSSLFTTTTTTSATSNISPSSASHSSSGNSIAVVESSSHSPGGMGGGLPYDDDDGSFLTDRLLGSDLKKQQPKRKLVINGVSEEDVKGYEAVKAWCESFGEVKEMRRTPDGYLHVDFRKASVAETVCRLKTQVFIKGAGSVSLSWYTMENQG